MFSLLVGLVLIVGLLFILSWRWKHPLRKHPLDVEDNLPLPWLAQTSTVFSLTALFGAYLGVAMTLGLPALMGLAFGTVLGLFAVRYWIERTLTKLEKQKKRFEDFLGAIMTPNKRHTTAFALVVAGIQCVYATSELLILRELAKAALGLKSEQATLVAIGVAIVGYFYVLLGGYLALFRTDVAQLGLIGLMAVTSSIFVLIRQSEIGWATSNFWPRPGFWEVSSLGTGVGLYAYHFLLATVMGLGLLLASPDTWKRVYQVNRDQLMKKKHSVRARFLTFVGVGVLPYLVLFPLAITIGTRADPQNTQNFALPTALSNNWLYGAVAFGLVASFLSSFNSALLGGVHVVLIWQRRVWRQRTKLGRLKKVVPEEARFYVIIMAVFTAICLVFVTALELLCNPVPGKFNNPWLLGNLLMGGYAAIAGLLIGSAGRVFRLPKFSLEIIFTIVMVVWVRYFLSSPGFSQRPTVFSVNTIPPAVALAFATTLVTRLLILFFGDRNNVR